MTDNKIDVSQLGAEDFKSLTPEQFQMVAEVQVELMNQRAAQRMAKELEDKTEDVMRALTEPPFTYRSSEIQVMAGCKVRFVTPITVQIRDAYKRLDRFLMEENPSQTRTADFLHRELLVHSLLQINGNDFGGVSFDPSDYQQLRAADPKQAQEMLEEVRTQRLQALDDMNPVLVQRLVEYYRAFQTHVESLAKSDPGDALGN